MEGTLTFRIDGKDVALAPGQSVFIKREIVHSFRNDTQQPAACLSVLTPALGAAYFRELAALMSAGGPPDPPRSRTSCSATASSVPGA